MASEGTNNLSAHRKAAALVSRYGERGFDYAGNSQADVPVWSKARRAVVVAATASVTRAAREHVEVERQFTRDTGGARHWIKALRLHQWLKNLLLFLPLLGAHQLLNLPLLRDALLAFLSFGFCASSVYVLNDLMDLESDRRHPRKRKRPYAAGQLSPLAGVAMSTMLLLGAFAIATLVRRHLRGDLDGYPPFLWRSAR